jgi:hypothetical protein
MFDLFKKDIKIGDKVKLYLTTGKEPEGIVISIGDNFVSVQGKDDTQTKFFDKLIGGWDVITSPKISKPKNPVETNIPNFTKTEIDQQFIIEQLKLFKSSLSKNLLVKFIEPNANIVEVRGTTCLASNDNNSKILILNNRLFDAKLISEIESFTEGSIIPVVLSIYESKGKTIVTTAVTPAKLEDYLNTFLEFITSKNYEKANLILSVIRNYVSENGYLGTIIKEFQKLYNQFKNREPKTLQVHVVQNTEGKKFFKSVEKEINDLIRQSKFDFALKQIDVELTNKSIEEKYKSSLLLKKAQIFSSLSKPEESEKAYSELVNFNETIKAPVNNLSHLYTELARLQSLKADKKEEAIKSVKLALVYNRNNNFAENLLKQLEGTTQKTKKEGKETTKESDEHLIIETTEDKSIISNMIDLDIKEHKYSHPEIIKNGGSPSTFIAELIIKEARDSGGIKVTENYPLYLEAAKAFSELNVGSYELKDYLEAVAYYSMLKGNSLYAQFKYNLINKEIDLQSLDRLNESACDYYIETLNIISNIDTKSLGLILTNYLQLKVARHYLETEVKYDFENLFGTKFSSLFNTCLWSKEDQVKKIGFKAIVDIGSNSFSMWNKLNDIFLNSNIKIKSIIDKESNKKLINNVLKSNINIDLIPATFLKNAFNFRKQEVFEYGDKSTKFFKIEFTPTNFRALKDEWSSLSMYSNLLQKTDKETFLVVDNIIQIIQPYLNRNDKERGNILYSVIKKIENQLDFINQNTTFYGRTFFYRLLKKWRSEVDDLFEEKIAQSYPLLLIEIDPPYYIETENKISAPLIIKNDGDATAEGYFLKIICESTVYESEVEIPFETAEELPSKGKKEFSFVIPAELLEDASAVEVKVEIEAVYQKNRLPAKKYEFTIEKEPNSFLTIEDIPWRTGNSTPESLFFGRDKLISDLYNHYRSVNKDKPYILYGLTRTGKSSILEYLRKKIDKTEVVKNGNTIRYIAFEWELQEISNNINARDFYNDILYDRLYSNTKKVLEKDNKWDNSLVIDDKGKFTDFKKILEFLKSNNYYPIIFVDEFSYIMDLMNKGTIGKPFLAALREYTLNGLVSFVFAGTYDIRKLITDEKYGITGQLVHVIENQVDKIDDEDAESLITIIDKKLSFTPEAINHIKQLSGKIPYFIQIICKNCGDYAVENKRRVIGYPELEKVIQILTGELNSDNSIISRLPVGIFQNNQYSTTDPKEIEVLISTLCFYNKKSLNPRGIGSHEIEKFWSEKGLSTFKSKLATSFQSLIDRKILLVSLDEGLPVYKFSVDLFRRWWHMSHQDINLEISTLKEE